MLQGIVLEHYSKFEGGEPPKEDEAELRKKRFLKKLPEPGVRGQNKVSVLAKDLAYRFNAEAPAEDSKKEVCNIFIQHLNFLFIFISSLLVVWQCIIWKT